jgi:hypothetical protein
MLNKKILTVAVQLQLARKTQPVEFDSLFLNGSYDLLSMESTRFIMPCTPHEYVQQALANTDKME